MAKDFFKRYFSLKTTLETSNYKGSDMPYNALNYEVLKALDRYITSFRWCKNDTERAIYFESRAGKVANKMNIVVTVEGKQRTLKPESVRSACSKLNKRLYTILGDNCLDLLLAYAENDEIAKSMHNLISLCVRLTDDYCFQQHYFLPFEDMIHQKIKEYRGVKVPSSIKINEIDPEVLSFFKDYSNECILERLSKLDSKNVAYIYQILNKPDLFEVRANVLEVLSTTDLTDTEVLISSKDVEIKELKRKLVKAVNIISELRKQVNNVKN